MTMAEELEQKGMQQGMQQGKLDMAKNLVAQGVDGFAIAKASGLDPTTIESLKEETAH